eukprot:g16083.t1
MMSTAAGVPKSDWSLPNRQGLQIEDENEYAGAASAAPILFVEEAEHYVEGLREFSMEEIGSSSWFEQYRRLAKLNLQAHQSAMARSDEYVLEALLTFDKLSVVVHELLAIEAWKEPEQQQIPLGMLLTVGQFVLPALLKTERSDSGKCTMRLYFTLYHEATLTNLLKIAMFHGHICEQAGDLLIELADYCARKMTLLISGRASSKPRRTVSSNAREVAKDIEERIAKQSPAQEGTWQKFVDFEWKTVAVTDLLQVTKTEGQVWLAMYHLMCEEECRKRYHFNSMRKNNILRARKYLNDVLLDQYMDELTIMEVPEPPSMGTTGSLLMEQIPKVRQSLTRGHDWDDLALKATLSDGGVFCAYDDADDPDVKSVAALFAAGEHEQWGIDPDAGAAAVPGEPSAAAVAAAEAARAAKAEASRKQEAPASSVNAENDRVAIH